MMLCANPPPWESMLRCRPYVTDPAPRGVDVTVTIALLTVQITRSRSVLTYRLSVVRASPDRRPTGHLCLPEPTVPAVAHTSGVPDPPGLPDRRVGHLTTVTHRLH